MPSQVITGAIRWDAWYATSGAPREAQDTLDYGPWQSRLPWFSKRDGPEDIAAIGNQENMDEESPAWPKFAIASTIEMRM